MSDAANTPSVLDNPIWYALQTGNRNMACGNDKVQYIRRDAGAFAGMPHNSIEELEALHGMIPAGEVVVLFTTGLLAIPEGWHIQLNRDLLQMAHTSPLQPFSAAGLIQSLSEVHIPEMLALTALTKPDPFLQRTIDFGNYEGIFENGKLVAMAGQRLQPDPYTEVSAVCTHPDALGKGYAALLLQSQVYQIKTAGRIPFLHVYPENTRAVALYQRVGFELRKEMRVYVLERGEE
jgi:ribosomal protein S18 acetylase RimI-like enzyme